VPTHDFVGYGMFWSIKSINRQIKIQNKSRARLSFLCAGLMVDRTKFIDFWLVLLVLLNLLLM
jgi:hypothetical protein